MWINGFATAYIAGMLTADLIMGIILYRIFRNLKAARLDFIRAALLVIALEVIASGLFSIVAMVIFQIERLLLLAGVLIVIGTVVVLLTSFIKESPPK